MQELAIIIVNWNGRELLKNCLDSLRGQTYTNFKVILVDNGSEDESVFFVKTNYLEIEIIELSENTGFAKANNIGIQKALADENIKYIVTLNNDTKADSKYLEELVAGAKKFPAAASIQPKVLNFYNPTCIDTAGILIHWTGAAFNRGNGKRDGEDFQKETEIFSANATASLYRREALEKTALAEGEYFDSNYFAYYEDVDLAWRLRLAGYASFYVPSSIVYHIQSATGKNLSKLFYLYRNSFFTIVKNFPPCLAVVALTISPLRFLYSFFKLRKSHDKWPVAFLKEFGSVFLYSWILFFQNLCLNMRYRRKIKSYTVIKKRAIGSLFKNPLFIHKLG